jgi:hypothetical protein
MTPIGLLQWTQAKAVRGMDQWVILVLGTLRLGLNADYDRIQELANQHKTLRMMLGHGPFDNDKEYRLQILKDNLHLFAPEIMTRINTEGDESSKQHIKETRRPFPLRQGNNEMRFMILNMNAMGSAICLCYLHRLKAGGM